MLKAKQLILTARQETLQTFWSYFLMSIPVVTYVLYMSNDAYEYFVTDNPIISVLGFSLFGLLLFGLPHYNKWRIRGLSRSIRGLNKEVSKDRSEFIKQMDPELRTIISDILRRDL